MRALLRLARAVGRRRSGRSIPITGLAGALLATHLAAGAYPLDAFDDTGIRRLDAAQRIEDGRLKGTRQPSGALLDTAQVVPHLVDSPVLEIPKVDAAFTDQIRKLLGEKADRYAIAVLDMSDPEQPAYAEHRGAHRQNVGSVGKILVVLSVFQALADLYPDDLDARRRVLRETVVVADGFIRRDHHKVRLWDPEAGRLERRPLREGDRGSLWEYLDWALSPSSNAAAAMVTKHAMLMVQFGARYPVSDEESGRFFKETPKKELSALLARTLDGPVTRNGLDLRYLRQGSFFTREGKHRVPGTTSHGSARELVRLLVAMEQGRLVDGFTSRELKRLLYNTERRIRYASSPALRDAAVYDKSGSLYSCKPEEGFKCGKYMGNVRNYMNSVALIESPAGTRRYYYAVALVSNVLRKNSAVDHQTLATRIHRLIERRHSPP